jgi:hypothetical protein
LTAADEDAAAAAEALLALGSSGGGTSGCGRSSEDSGNSLGGGEGAPGSKPQGAQASPARAARLPRLGIAVQLLGVNYGAAGLGPQEAGWGGHLAPLPLPPPLLPRRGRALLRRPHLTPALAPRRPAEFRRQGVGSALLELLEEVAAEAG